MLRHGQNQSITPQLTIFLDRRTKDPSYVLGSFNVVGAVVFLPAATDSGSLCILTGAGTVGAGIVRLGAGRASLLVHSLIELGVRDAVSLVRHFLFLLVVNCFDVLLLYILSVKIAT